MMQVKYWGEIFYWEWFSQLSSSVLLHCHRKPSCTQQDDCKLYKLRYATMSEVLLCLILNMCIWTIPAVRKDDFIALWRSLAVCVFPFLSYSNEHLSIFLSIYLFSYLFLVPSIYLSIFIHLLTHLFLLVTLSFSFLSLFWRCWNHWLAEVLI